MQSSAAKGASIESMNGKYSVEFKAHLTKSTCVTPPPAIEVGQLTIWRKIAVPRARKMPRIESIWLNDISCLNVTFVVSVGSPASNFMIAT